MAEIINVGKKITELTRDKLDDLLKLDDLVSMVGKKVNIDGIDCKGKITEVIFGTQNTLHFKIKLWIEFDVAYIVLERDEFTLIP